MDEAPLGFGWPGVGPGGPPQLGRLPLAAGTGPGSASMPAGFQEFAAVPDDFGSF